MAGNGDGDQGEQGKPQAGPIQRCMVTPCQQRSQEIELDQDGDDPRGCERVDPVEHVEVDKKESSDNLLRRRQILGGQISHDDPCQENRDVKQRQNPNSPVKVESQRILTTEFVLSLPVTVIDAVAGYGHEEPNRYSAGEGNQKEHVFSSQAHRGNRFGLEMMPDDSEGQEAAEHGQRICLPDELAFPFVSLCHHASCLTRLCPP